MLRRVALVRTDVSEERSVTSQKTPFFIVTAVKTSNLTKQIQFPKYCVFLVIYNSGRWTKPLNPMMLGVSILSLHYGRLVNSPFQAISSAEESLKQEKPRQSLVSCCDANNTPAAAAVAVKRGGAIDT
jgi:hypothetical protein